MKRLLAKIRRSLNPAGPKTEEQRRAPVKERQRTREDEPSALERLPPEIRRHLLASLDLHDLKALVRASPTFHQQYRLDHGFLLVKGLENTLGRALVEAHAVQVSTAQSTRTKKEAIQSVKDCAKNVASRQITADDAVEISNFYLRFAEPVLRRFIGHTLETFLKQKTQPPGEPADEPTSQPSLTATETARFTRAIYRLQLLCQAVVFTPDPYMYSEECREVAAAFIKDMKPWEIEELLTFIEFVHGYHDDILESIKGDLHPDNPRFDDQRRPPTPTGAYEIDGPYNRDQYLDGFLLQGLPFLVATSQLQDHEQLVLLMQKHMENVVYGHLNAPSGIFSDMEQTERREASLSVHDRKQEERLPMPFVGDDDLDTPPLAWTVMWRDIYSNLYGAHVPDGLRAWGYIFWDAERLRRTGADKLVKEQFERDYWNGDPRQYIVLDWPEENWPDED